jgi:hypothetical protein
MKTGMISTTSLQRALGDRVTVGKDTRGLDVVFIDHICIGSYYPHGLVSMADIAGSHISDDDLAKVDNI